MVGKYQQENQSQIGLKDQLFHPLKTLNRYRIALTTLSVTRMKKMKIIAYLTQTMKNRIGHCASSNNVSTISLKFLYMETSVYFFKLQAIRLKYKLSPFHSSFIFNNSLLFSCLLFLFSTIIYQLLALNLQLYYKSELLSVYFSKILYVRSEHLFLEHLLKATSANIMKNIKLQGRSYMFLTKSKFF